MDNAQFEQFAKTMYRTFNFLCALEDMDIEQVYILQNNEPKEHNISMTAKEFCEAFEKYTDLDVEQMVNNMLNTTTRYENNVKILKYIAKYIDNNPQQRFIQILWNLGIINRNEYDSINIEDKYYEESEITLKKLLDK